MTPRKPLTMKQTLTDLFTSKKFLAALTAIIVYVAGRFGFDVDTAILDRIFAAFLVYVGAQGIADNGKSSAQILSAVRAPVPVPSGLAIAPPLPRDPQAGSVTMLNLLSIVLVGGVIGATVFIGCTATQARQTSAAGAIATLDCEAAHLDAQALADAKAFAMAEVQHWLAGGAAPSSDAIRADLAPIKSDLGRCAIAGALAAVAVLVQPTPGAAISALTVGPDPAQVRAAFAVAARRDGWPLVILPGGDAL